MSIAGDRSWAGVTTSALAVMTPGEPLFCRQRPNLARILMEQRWV